MGNLIGLILYVLVVFISGYIKKAADEKARERRLEKRTVEAEPAVVTFEEFEADIAELFVAEDDEETFGLTEVDDSIPEEQDVEEWSAQRSVKPRLKRTSAPKLDLAQAVVMTEIIREPRAQRPWPQR